MSISALSSPNVFLFLKIMSLEEEKTLPVATDVVEILRYFVAV